MGGVRRSHSLTGAEYETPTCSSLFSGSHESSLRMSSNPLASALITSIDAEALVEVTIEVMVGVTRGVMADVTLEVSLREDVTLEHMVGRVADAMLEVMVGVRGVEMMDVMLDVMVGVRSPP